MSRKQRPNTDVLGTPVERPEVAIRPDAFQEIMQKHGHSRQDARSSFAQVFERELKKDPEPGRPTLQVKDRKQRREMARQLAKQAHKAGLRMAEEKKRKDRLVLLPEELAGGRPMIYLP